MVDKRFFRKKKTLTLGEVIKISGSKTKGDPNKKINDISTLKKAGSEDLAFFSNPKYTNEAKNTKAGFCLIEEKNVHYLPKSCLAIISDNPYFSYSLLISQFYETLDKIGEDLSISKESHISSSANIGKGCTIKPGAYIGSNVIIGNNCYIGPNAIIERGCNIGSNCYIGPGACLMCCEVGEGCIIHNGCQIGQDGFGFAHSDKGQMVKTLQLGRVIIGNKVEIGANTCIDRGAIDDTIIGDLCIIDNLNQIGHGVKMGVGCVLAGCSALAGSSIFGDFVQIGGHSSIAGHLKIGSGVKIAAKSGVMKDLKDKEIVGGSPTLPIKKWHKLNIKLKKLLD